MDIVVGDRGIFVGGDGFVGIRVDFVGGLTATCHENTDAMIFVKNNGGAVAGKFEVIDFILFHGACLLVEPFAVASHGGSFAEDDFSSIWVDVHKFDNESSVRNIRRNGEVGFEFSDDGEWLGERFGNEANDIVAVFERSLVLGTMDTLSVRPTAADGGSRIFGVVWVSDKTIGVGRRCRGESAGFGKVKGGWFARRRPRGRRFFHIPRGVGVGSIAHDSINDLGFCGRVFSVEDIGEADGLGFAFGFEGKFETRIASVRGGTDIHEDLAGGAKEFKGIGGGIAKDIEPTIRADIDSGVVFCGGFYDTVPFLHIVIVKSRFRPFGDTEVAV